MSGNLSSSSRALLLLRLMLHIGFSQLGSNTFCRAFQTASQSNKPKRQSVSSRLFASASTEYWKMNSTNEPDNTKARLVSVDSLDECGARLREGDLVAFPTETVYGLGCNALDHGAIMKVFKAKERPLTDPLITHVTKHADAYKLWNAEPTSIEGQALRRLCDKFWPGPFTLVAKAAPHVPQTLMANTGFVACRAPQHPISVALIDAAKVPIAAPSANKFGHVSPTKASHVWDDLYAEDVWIMDTTNGGAEVCDVGVESSVVKMEIPEGSETGTITLLRQGAVSVRDIENCLEEVGLQSNFSVLSRTKKAIDETIAEVAPGQNIRHYSPNIVSRIISQSCYTSNEIPNPEKVEVLSKTVLIDFGGKLSSWEKHAIAYRDLSKNGDSAEATKSVFDILRWAEQVDGATQILFPEILDGPSVDALTLALKDRLTRAASGVVINSITKK